MFSTVSTGPPGPPIDDVLPGASVLTGELGRLAVAEFLTEQGWEFEDAKPVQAMYRPRRSMVVRHRATARDVDGSARVLNVCTAVGPVEEHPAVGGPVVTSPSTVRRSGFLTTWAFPCDPALPMLGVAASGPAMREFLADAGVAAVRAVNVEPIAYRPGRRAAIRYAALDADGVRRLYGKVLRPSRADRLRRALAGLQRRPGVRLATPIAQSDGLFVTDPLPGRPLRDLLVQGGALPGPGRLTEAMRRVGRAFSPESLSRRPSPASVARTHRRVVAHLIPDLEETARAVEERGAELLGDATRRSNAVPVHGDFYDAQIFVAGDHSIGLIDLDDVGLGWPVMEMGNFAAHLLALAFAVPAAKPRALAYRTLALEHFVQREHVDAGALAGAEAVSLLGLAAGPFRVLEPDWRRAVALRVTAAAQLLGLDAPDR